MHIGSWGLPDLGITEWVNKNFAGIAGGYAPLSAQLGSDISALLTGNFVRTAYAQNPQTNEVYNLQAPSARNTSTGGPSVKGAQTVRPTSVSGSNPSGNNASSTGTNLSSGAEVDPLSRIRQEVEAIYSPLMNYYNQAEGLVTEEYNRYLPELQQQYETSLSNIQTQRQRGERELEEQREMAQQRREDALSAARRLYDELRRGGLQRFGGASSAGQAFTELTAAEQQRQAGNVWNLYQQAENQIARYKANLNEQFNQAEKELELAKTSALNKAYSDYQNRLNQIRAMRAQTESAKASLALEALYNLRNQINQINLSTLNLSQTLAANRQVALSYVDEYAKRVAQNIAGGRGTYESFTQQTTTTPTSNLSLNGNQATVVTPYQGRIYKRPEEYLATLNY